MQKIFYDFIYFGTSNVIHTTKLFLDSDLPSS